MPNNMAQQNTTTHRKRSCALSCSAGPGRRLQILCRSGEAGLILAVLGLMFFVGCTEETDQPAEQSDGQTKVSRSLTIIASGDTHGWIIPCGCTSNQSGGLLRRGTYVESKRQDAVVIPVDVGGAAGDDPTVSITAGYDRYRTRGFRLPVGLLYRPILFLRATNEEH